MSAARLPAWPRRIANTTSTLVCLVGLLGLIGWTFGIGALTSILPGLPNMAASTALLFMLAGFGVWCAVPQGKSADESSPIWAARRLLIARFCAGTAILVGALRLISYLAGWNLGLDQLWWSQLTPHSTVSRMSPATATDFVVLGLGLYAAGTPQWRRLVQIFALSGCLIGWLGFSRYWFGGLPILPYTQMAVHTAIAFMVLSVGLLCLNQDDGLVALILSEDSGGTIARRLVPSALFVPFLLGWLALKGEHAGWFEAEAGIALFALANVILFGGLIWANAFRLHIAEVDRHRTAETLRYSEERWATTLQSIGDAVISTDANGHIEFMNDVAQKLTGWSLPEASGVALSDVFNIVQEVTRIRPEDPVSKVLRLGQVVGLANHTLLIRRDGTEIPIEDSGAPIRSRDGRIEGVVLVFHDVSEQRKIERALRDTDRLAITGRLAATIAHEIHNPLDAVGNLIYLISQDASDKATREFASLAARELDGVTQMTQRMLTFQREAAKPMPVKIGEILESVTALYERKIKTAGIRLEQQIDFDGHILAMPGELRQIVANLLGNAIEAMGARRGTITLRAYQSRDWRRGLSGVRVVIADDGPGISASVRGKIFEPFFTTKGEGGTGLGLWIASDILRKYSGTMRLRSSTQSQSSGTCFSIFLPFDTNHSPRDASPANS